MVQPHIGFHHKMLKVLQDNYGMSMLIQLQHFNSKLRQVMATMGFILAAAVNKIKKTAETEIEVVSQLKNKTINVPN